MRSDQEPGGQTGSDQTFLNALVVEDERNVREVLTHVTSRCGYQCHTSETVAGARRKLSQHAFDLMLLDLRLPDESGEQLLREVRSNGREVAILIVSGLHETAVKVHMLDAGADDYMTKPFDIEELETRIKVLMRRRATARTRTVFDGRLQLDPVSRRVYSSSLSAHCTGIEFGILYLLAASPGEYVSAATIAREVFGDESGKIMSTLKPHITHVRCKLANVTDGVELQNRRGETGYRLAMVEPRGAAVEAVSADATQ